MFSERVIDLSAREVREWEAKYTVGAETRGASQERSPDAETPPQDPGAETPHKDPDAGTAPKDPGPGLRIRTPRARLINIISLARRFARTDVEKNQENTVTDLARSEQQCWQVIGQGI